MDTHDTQESAMWTVEPLAFRLRSPLHIGWRKVGNLMQTRPYVPAKNLWAALTAELARRQAKEGRAAAAQAYQCVGNDVAESLAFTYLFPALVVDPAQGVDPALALYPWLTPTGLKYGKDQLAAETFDYLFLDSYASTAITVGQNAAETGSLHETEMLRPRTRRLAGTPLAGSYGEAADELGVPVYLVGYALVKGEGLAGWRGALERLQIGGERRYGWGRIERAPATAGAEGGVFGYQLARAAEGRPGLRVPADRPMLAHALAADFKGATPVTGVNGPLEPVVGRETNANGKRGFGANLVEARVCWAPGTPLSGEQVVSIGKQGIWEGVA